MKKNLIILLIVSLSLLLIIFLLFFSGRNEIIESHINFQERTYIKKKPFNLAYHLRNFDSTNIVEQFPYSIYLDSSDINDINSISSYVAILDSINPLQKEQNQQAISIALTSKLESKTAAYFDIFKPDSLLRIIQWAEKLNFYSKIDLNKAILYQSIYTHWMRFVSNNLGNIYHNNPDIKYDFNFKYLNNRCKENQFGCSVNFTDSEKITNNFVESRWDYLFRKFWYDSKIHHKVAVVIIISIFLLGCYTILKFFKKNKL